MGYIYLYINNLKVIIDVINCRDCRCRRAAFARVAVFGAAAALMSSAVLAHHTYADFDAQRTVALSGTVESYRWVNPHVSFKMRVTPEQGGGAEAWTIETHGPAILKAYGWSARTLTAGMPVRVVCNPKRDGSRGCRLHTVFFPESGRTLQTKLSRSLKHPAAD